MSEPAYEWQLAPAARSVPEARRYIREALAGWDLDDLIDAATLLTSEIVTNSILHARSTVVLRVERDATSGVRISVTDASPVIPAMRRQTDTATTGRGMWMLDQLADDWRTEPTDGGKTVSFRLSGARDPWAVAEADG